MAAPSNNTDQQNQTGIWVTRPWVHTADFTYAEPGWQGFIPLPDGTHHGIGDGIVQVSERELQRQLAAKGHSPLTAGEIAYLKDACFVKQ
jgi:hypothetical protein